VTFDLPALLAPLPGLDVRYDEPMGPRTTYKVGGPAAAFIETSDEAALCALLVCLERAQIPSIVLGNGSNVLFADAGFSGVVIHLGQGFDGVDCTRDQHGPGRHRLEAGGAVSITRLLRATKDLEVAGVEFLGGVPGTIGGAIRMNAGTVMGEVSDSLESARVVTPDGRAHWIAASELELAYRTSSLPWGAVVVAARFHAQDADAGMRSRLAEVLAYRKSTQPLQYPSCGSVFANPKGDHAGRLIEACGLKGHRVGDAQVSEMHANWIINLGAATATDVRDLIDLCVRQVDEQHGVVLRHEVKMLGDWTGGAS
jgi:UDP-N-acetylmuramate dehydrogenase